MVDVSEKDDEPTRQGPEVSYVLTEARVIAVMKGGGALSKREAFIEVTEGRRWMYARDLSDDGEQFLEWHCTFEVPGCLATTSRTARITIVGEHENGAILQITGRGWVGYDQRGLVQGSFLQPPRITVLNGGRTDAQDLRDAAIADGAGVIGDDEPPHARPYPVH